MRHIKVLTTLQWISAFANVTLHSCSPARGDAILDYASVYQSEGDHSEGRSQHLTKTHHGGPNTIDIWQSALNSGATAAPTPSILRSTILQDRSQGSSHSRRIFEELLLEHCQGMLTRGRSQTPIMQLELRFEGICPTTHEKTVLRVADELLSNAVEHGYYARQRGHLVVHVISRADVCVQVSVSDDGWGFGSGPIIDGNGFRLLRQIGDLYIGAAPGPFVAKATVTVILPFHRCRATALPPKERTVI
jgi:hypothetical protein